MHIRVYIIPTGETISLEVEKTDTIDRLKALINEKEGIPPEKQWLLSLPSLTSYKGRLTLDECDICSYDAFFLHIGPRQILIETLTGETIILEVERSSTIHDIKNQIKDKVGVPQNQQKLFLDGNQLVDDSTLDDCNIGMGSTLSLLTYGPMQISIETLTGETIILKVENSNTIYDIKNKIKDKVGVPQNQQKLFFAGNQLVDDSTLYDCNIWRGSTLFLLTFRPMQILAERQVPTEGILLDQQHLSVTENQIIQIFVMTDSGKTITLQAKSSDTLGDVKFMIQEKEGIPSYHQKLFFADEQLVDSFTLDHYSIHNNSVLHLGLKSKKWMKIFVKSATGKTTGLEVKSFYPISMVKAMMDDKDGIPLVQQRLFFDGKELNDDCTLADYRIVNGSTLDLWFTACIGLMQIFVNTGNGKTITLKVKASDTIGNVKTKIEDEEGCVRPYKMKLFYNGQQLENRHTLAHYHIHKESTLSLFVMNRGPLKIFVKAFTAKTIALKVQSSDTISYLKALIEDSVGIPIDQQILLFDGKQLHDHDILANYYVQDESTIHLLPLSRGVLQILIKMPEKAIIMEVESSDIIGNLKAKIQGKESIPSCQQMKLFFKGKELDNCCKIADYNIHWNSVLHLEPGSSGLMQIAIKSESGKTTISVKVESSYTVGHVKAKIQEEEGFSLNNRSLLFNGNLLEDSLTLADYGIVNNSILHFGRLPLGI